MMRQLTVAAAFLLLSTANAASLRGAGDQGACLGVYVSN